MNAQELVLNIAVNLGRISRWAMEGKEIRVRQFLSETENYLLELKKTSRGEGFEKTYEKFVCDFKKLNDKVILNDEWAESMLTWANILTHRAKLA